VRIRQVKESKTAGVRDFMKIAQDKIADKKVDLDF
jgi:hypothetical protein